MSVMTDDKTVLHPRLQLAAVWSGLVFLGLYAIAFIAVARFVPPPSPGLSSTEVAALFDDHRLQIRLGMVLALIFSTLLFPFFAVISQHIARIERGHPLLATIQFGGATLLIVFFQLCSMIWITATFRSELDPAVIRMLNDLGWLSFVMVFPAYVFQLSCIAIAAFIDRSADPVWPRWAGYLNLWVATMGTGGGIAVFFKSGPFAWNGLFGFYVPIIAFLGWILAMTWLMHSHVIRHTVDREQAPA